MRTTIGDDKDNLALLRSLQKDLIRKEERQKEDARWNTFTEAVDNINCACGRRDLGELAAGVRRIKNLLRRPGVRKVLAQLEAKEGKEDKENGKKKPEGKCTCADCGKVIDGSVSPCAQGALCVDCGMKDRDVSPGEKEDKKDEKKAKKGTAFPPEMIGQGGGGDKQGVPPEKEPEEEPPKKKPEPKEPEKQPPGLRKKKGKKKNNKETNAKQWMKDKKKVRNEGKLRCRRYHMASMIEDNE